MKADEIVRFRKICGMLASDQPGEVVAAAAKATAMLKTAGLTWEDVSPPMPQSASIRASVWGDLNRDRAQPSRDARPGWTQPTAKPKDRPPPEDADVHWRDSKGPDPNFQMRMVLRGLLKEILDNPEKYELVGKSRARIMALVAKRDWSSFDLTVVSHALAQAGLG